MALTKVSRGLLSTGIVDNSNATAITIDSDENVTIGSVGSGTASATPVELNLGSTFANSAGSLSKAKFKLFEDSSANVYGLSVSSGLMVFGVPSSAGYAFFINESEKLRIDSSGKVVIGGTSSNQLLNVTSSTTPAIEFTRGSGNATIGIDNGSSIAVGATAGDLVIRASGTTGVTRFTDSGGDITMTLLENNTLLVGKTADDNSVGFKTNTSSSYMVASGQTPTFINRLSDDGDVLEFRKDSSKVGSIGSQGGANIYITSGNRGIRLNDGDFSPITSANAYSDNSVDLGRSTARFQDLFLSGGVFLGGTDSPHHLEYYEDGITWTPSQSGVTLSVTTATAIRVGNLVTINARIVFPANSDTTVVAISGLPFARATHYQSAGGLMHSNVNLPSGYTQLAYYLGGSSINLYACGDDVAFAALRNNNLSGADIIFTISYETNA